VLGPHLHTALAWVGQASLTFAAVIAGVSLWALLRGVPFDEPMTGSARLLIGASWFYLALFAAALLGF
jgi:hypothetical protein